MLADDAAGQTGDMVEVLRRAAIEQVDRWKRPVGFGIVWRKMHRDAAFIPAVSSGRTRSRKLADQGTSLWRRKFMRGITGYLCRFGR